MTNLVNYGFTPDMGTDNGNGIPARVTAVNKERYDLICTHGEVCGRLKKGVYYGNRRELFPTVGDFVLVAHNPMGDSQIVKTLPRKICFSRRDPTPGRGEQAVAANFDFVFIMQSLGRDFNTARLERYLTLARQSRAEPVVVLTKIDLAEDYQPHVRAAEKAAAGARVLAVSAKTGAGIGALSEYLKPRRTVVLLGSSGVGKSSLVNALAGEESTEVGEVREGDERGRHTTTRRQLHMLPGGAMVIDTPGMREIGMWDVGEGLDGAFADVERHLGRCRYSDCGHRSEPGCAIRAAIERGELPQKRWESYLSLKAEARSSEGREPRPQSRYAAKARERTQKADYRREPCPETFTCKSCGSTVVPEGAGSGHRNHCPTCLSSLHADNEPGDRASLCGGIMEPIGVWVRKDGEWAIIHRCRSCGKLSSNRVAADDNPTLLMSIAVKPFACPPFPLSKLEQIFSKGENA